MPLLSKFISALPSRGMIAKMATFGIVGAGNALVDLSIFTPAYTVFDLPLVPASIIAWSIAVSVPIF